jgi:MFS family permease
MNASIRWRLSLMMFLEYAVWGVWAPILVLHLVKLDAFTGPAAFTRVNHIYMTMAIASIIAPFVAGQIADRYFATQRFLALSHLAGGVLLLVVARLTGYGSIFFGMLAYSIIYAPTLALTNSICFHHLPDGEKDFSRIRLWGTIGWVVIAWVFSLWIGLADGLLGEIAPAVETALVHWRQSLVHKPDVVDCLYASAAGILQRRRRPVWCAADDRVLRPGPVDPAGRGRADGAASDRDR